MAQTDQLNFTVYKTEEIHCDESIGHFKNYLKKLSKLTSKIEINTKG